MPRLISSLVRWLGIEPGWPGRIVVAPDASTACTVVVLCLEEREPPSPIVGCDHIALIAAHGWWLHDRRVRHYADWAAFAHARASGNAADVASEAVLHALESATFLPLARLVGYGVRRFHFTYAAGASFSVPRRTALLLGAWGSAHRCAAQALRSFTRRAAIGGWVVGADAPSRRAVRAAFLGAVRRSRATLVSATARAAGAAERREIVHYISDLSPGGAERQLLELVSEQRARGLPVRVLTALPLVGTGAHFAPALAAAGVSDEAIPARRRFGPRRALADVLAAGLDAELVAAVEAHPARHRLVPLLEALHRSTPAVLHCWLDEPNAIGALAGLTTGVPRVLLSTRSLSPSRHPRFLRTWYRPSYRLAARAAAVRLVANSAAGADDYARWSGLDRRRFTVIHNDIDIARLEPASAAERAALRARIGIAPDAFLVAAIHRFTVEKRPLDFLAAIARLRDQLPGMRAIHVGTGPDEARVHACAAELRLDGVLRFLGRVPDPERWLAIADACLLTSEFEGCPNVPLEAQALGIPALVTDGGGCPEVVLHGETGFVCGVGDVAAMAARLGELAADRERGAEMGRHARAFVRERFSIERMVRETLALYG